jgi:hypothetical protein
MNEDEVRRLIAEEVARAIAELSFEVVGVNPGHRVTTYYHLVVRHAGRVAHTIPLGDDGDEDVGFRITTSRLVRRLEEIDSQA